MFLFKSIVYFDNALDRYLAILCHGIGSFEDGRFVVLFWAGGSCFAAVVVMAVEEGGMTLWMRDGRHFNVFAGMADTIIFGCLNVVCEFQGNLRNHDRRQERNNGTLSCSSMPVSERADAIYSDCRRTYIMQAESYLQRTYSSHANSIQRLAIHFRHSEEPL